MWLDCGGENHDETRPRARRLPTPRLSRRAALVCAGAAVAGSALPAWSNTDQVSFGLTPVFLSDDQELLRLIRSYLEAAVGEPVQLVQRRTYQEITAMLLAGQIDAAWICGYPFVRHREQLSVMAVPIWRGRPLYQSLSDREVGSRGGAGSRICAATSTRSPIRIPTPGYLVTRAALAGLQATPDGFFSRSFFTYGHRNVVRAVASGLAQSGSVDGYVWEALASAEPNLTDGDESGREVGLARVSADRLSRRAGRERADRCARRGADCDARRSPRAGDPRASAARRLRAAVAGSVRRHRGAGGDRGPPGMRRVGSLRSLPLAAKAPLLVAALMIALGAVASERVLTRLAEIQQERLRDLAGLYFDGLSVAILPAALRGDVWEAFDALDRAARQRRGMSALVTTLATEDGVVLASSDPLRFPSGEPMPEDLQAAAVPEAVTLDASRPTVLVRSPLSHQGQLVGQLHAELDVSDLLADRRSAIVYLLAGNALATVLLSLIGYVVVRRLLRPLTILADHMGTR